MQRYFFICFFLTTCLFDSNAQSKHYFELGLNSDYFIHRIKYGDINFSNAKSLNISYTYLFKKVYLKADYSYSTWYADMDFFTYTSTVGRKSYWSYVINSKENSVFNFGAGYKFNGKFKNTFLFVNLSYSDYEDTYFANGISWESSEGDHIKKDFGMGFDLKQHIPIFRGIYSYIDFSYNRYLNKAIFAGSTLQNYCNLSAGLGYRF